MARETYKLKILDLLRENPEREWEAYQLEKYYRLSKTPINAYLIDLENDSLIERRKVGYFVFWKATDSRMSLSRRIITRKWNCMW